MQSNILKASLLMLSLFNPQFSRAQTSYLYDQQSALEGASGGLTYNIQALQPIGQSFTPELTSVGFIRLRLGDITNGNNIGATLVVHLRSNSITGPILGTTQPAVLPDRFYGYSDFLFSEAVAVTPGVIYYFQPVVQTGDPWAIIGYNSYNYGGGNQFVNGGPFPANDLWFREGVIVPEPSTVTLAAVGVGLLVLWHRRRAVD